MAQPGDANHEQRYNRDEDIKPASPQGRPPRPATEPDGAEESSRTSKTATDPQTGEPNRSRRKPGS